MALTRHGGQVRALAFTPDGRTLVTGGTDGKVRLWDLAAPQAATSLAGHPPEAWAVAYGVPNATVASQLMSTFAQNQPNWDHPNAQATYYDAAACPGTTCQQPVGYWPPVGWAFHRVGDSVEASTGARSIHAGAVADHRAKPFSVGWDGMLLRLEILAMTHR